MIENQNSSIIYTADGTQTEWSFPYFYVNAADIKLFVTIDDVTTEIAAENYSFDETTKKVTYPLLGDPVAAGGTVTLVRQTPITQLGDSSLAYFKSTDIELMLDKVTAICQDLQRQINELKQVED